MKDRYKWTSERIVAERFQSDLLPINELSNGGYEGLSDKQKNAKLKADFDAFLRKKAQIVMKVVNLLVEGCQLSPAETFDE